MRYIGTIASVSITLAAVTAGAWAAEGERDEMSPNELILMEKGIEPTAEGLADYLSQLHPSQQQRDEALDLIGRLGSDEFLDREAAMQRLLIMPVLDTAALGEAAEHEDPEVRWRARRVLALGRPQTDRLLYAAFRTIHSKALAPVIPQLIRAIPLCEKRHLRESAQAALVAAAGRDELDLITPAISSENEHVRCAATAALGNILGEDADEQLKLLSKDESDHVRLAATRAMANYGERAALPVLADLLAAEDVYIRTHSAATLRSLTGRQFGFAAYDKDDRRAASGKKWQEWIDSDGQTAKLSFPLKPLGHSVSYLGGNMLLAFGNRHKVVEYDPSGKEVWSYQCTGAWSAEKMANGNVLIASNSQSKVIEVDRAGKIVWEYGTRNPLNAKPLPNGNVLIAGFTQRKALEVSRDKKIVWQYDAPHYVCDIHRLENGNTLVASMNGPIQEVTPQGKTVWQYDFNRTYGVQPLANGNILIASIGGEVKEVSRDKKVVWEHKEQNAADAFRLPNGNTLITGSRRFVEVTPDGKEVWSKDGCQYGTARR